MDCKRKKKCGKKATWSKKTAQREKMGLRKGNLGQVGWW